MELPILIEMMRRAGIQNFGFDANFYCFSASSLACENPCPTLETASGE